MRNCCKGSEQEFDEVKRGAWTGEEDNLLIHYINSHGEGRWNSLAKSAGLKRTGKSCRLRWLNYLKPDTKRGNLSPQEQLVILDLHSKWGNRWSKIARYLPGRTDNEIKNYWRTRVQKQARHLNIDSSSNRFVEALHRFWMPRLLEKVEQTSSSTSNASTVTIENKSLSACPQSEQTLLTSLPYPQKPTNEGYINSTSSVCATEYSSQMPEMSQLYGDKASSLQNVDCYDVSINELDMIDFGSDDLSIGNFHLADNDHWIRSDDMAPDTYWKLDELW
ncbi:hypothetical protein QVD17_03428 [Tagetes erecta]|uniref:Uncharacterized protein n=1 Tax=Tagetes erecta TaxID=13708 RepID=A0AAD8LB98_TARER|nr:hypothetical protein QVD17_03428 [Tagetes erecta]